MEKIKSNWLYVPQKRGQPKGWLGWPVPTALKIIDNFSLLKKLKNRY
jgi:hypothetical protein